MQAQFGARRSRRARLLPVFLACSAALHVAVLVALPRIEQHPPPPVRMLEVVLVRPEPPALAARTEPQPPLPEAVTPPAFRAEKKPRAAAPAGDRPAVRAEPDVRTEDRAAPEEVAAPETGRQQDVEAAPGIAARAPAAEPAGAAAAKDESSPAAREAEPVSGPLFNAGYLRNPPPRYPLIARRNGEQGTVLLKVLVTREGVPSTVQVEGSSGSEHLDRAALEAVKNWRFVPAKRGSRAIEAWVLVPIVFRLEGSS